MKFLRSVVRQIYYGLLLGVLGGKTSFITQMCGPAHLRSPARFVIRTPELTKKIGPLAHFIAKRCMFYRAFILPCFAKWFWISSLFSVEIFQYWLSTSSFKKLWYHMKSFFECKIRWVVHSRYTFKFASKNEFYVRLCRCVGVWGLCVCTYILTNGHLIFPDEIWNAYITYFT